MLDWENLKVVMQNLISLKSWFWENFSSRFFPSLLRIHPEFFPTKIFPSTIVPSQIPPSILTPGGVTGCQAGPCCLPKPSKKPQVRWIGISPPNLRNEIPKSLRNPNSPFWWLDPPLGVFRKISWYPSSPWGDP